MKWSKVIRSQNKIYVFVDLGLGLGLINDAFQKVSYMQLFRIKNTNRFVETLAVKLIIYSIMFLFIFRKCDNKT